jgi:predicted nucleic acid-binding protein
MASERLVVDASFVIEALLPTSSEWQSEAFDLLDRIATRDIDARVPWIFFAELAAVVTKKTRSRRLDPQDASDFLERIDALGMHVDLTLEQSQSLHLAAMHWNCGAYDSIYIDAAYRMAVPLATRDRGMIAAARLIGVPVF